MSGAPVLVAPDKFKGTFSAAEVAAAIASGLRARRPRRPRSCRSPTAARERPPRSAARRCRRRAHDALGRPVEASFAWLDDGETAVVEAAAASGLWRLAPDELDPLAATSAGTGELIAAAIDAGARHVIVACGGTATVDGGRGMLEALGEVPRGVRFTAVCDVRTPWEQAAAVFGPQKGADRTRSSELRRRLAPRRARCGRTRAACR